MDILVLQQNKHWCVLCLMFQETGLHYDRYLREVIEYLEKDPHFKEKLKNTNMDDIKVAVHAHQTAQYFVSLLLT